MLVTRAWMEKWYPDFVELVDKEIVDAHARTDELLGKGHSPITDEQVKSAKANHKKVQQRGKRQFYLPDKIKQEIKLPRGERARLCYVWLVLCNGDIQAATWILARHPLFGEDKNLVSASVASIAKNYGFKELGASRCKTGRESG